MFDKTCGSCRHWSRDTACPGGGMFDMDAPACDEFELDVLTEGKEQMVWCKSIKEAKSTAHATHELRVREAAESIDSDATSLLILLARIREAAGDPTGKLMFDEFVAHVAKLKSDCELFEGIYHNHLAIMSKVRKAAGVSGEMLDLDKLVEHIALLKSRADGKRWRSPADLVAVPDGSKVFALVDDGGDDAVWVEATISRWLRDELDKTPGQKLLGWLPMPPDDCVED